MTGELAEELELDADEEDAGVDDTDEDAAADPAADPAEEVA